ncbi:thiamine phosphate synthase [Helicobacter ailurogastricus]|uniref:thiamine phosphate synthase n=2 Tax=Helicobacter ailurogastricus TaxID=1578720 RepID=UPI000CF1A133|nr:thiamine phosphate synthase [Helicobacter ailurogastricus]
MFESYFITPEVLQTLNAKEFEACLTRVFKTHAPNRACLRQADTSRPFSPAFYSAFARLCHAFKITAYLNLQTPQQSLDCALEHGFAGVHLKGNALDFASKIPQDLQKFYSAHNALEVQKALDLGIHLCTLSPLFKTPNKPPPLGLDYLQALSPELKAHVFALGGITTHEQIELVKNLHIKGFASIRYFLNDWKTA